MKKLLPKITFLLAAAAVLPSNAEASVQVSLSEYACTPTEVVADLSGKAEFTVSFKVTNSGTETISPGDEGYKFLIGKFGFSGDLQAQVGEITGDVALAPEESTTVTVGCSYTLPDVAADETLSLKFNEFFNNTVTPQYAYECPKVKILSPVAKMTLKDGTTTVSSGSVVDYGVVSVENAKTFTVSNSGRSDLAITGITFDDELAGCRADVAFPVIVAPGENAELPIVLSGKECGKKGKVTVAYNDAAADAELAFYIKGAVTAADAWVETFNDGVPAGWDNIAAPGSTGTNRWGSRTINGNTIVEQGNADNKQRLVTPLMTIDPTQPIVVQAGHSYVSSNNGSVLTVYYSPDRVEWTELGKVVKSIGTTRAPFNTFEWSGTENNVLEWYNFATSKIPAGDYYVAFEAGQCMLDNIYGMEPAEIDHDLIVDGLTVPATAMVNYPMTISVNVRNMLGMAEPAENYSIVLYSDGVEVARAESVEIPAYGSVSIPCSYTSHAEGENEFKAVLTIDGKDLAASGTVNVEGESSEMPVQVGAVENCVNTAPFGLDGYASRFQSIYTAEDLGLKAGSTITAITLPGYYSGYSDMTKKVAIALEPTEKSGFSSEDVFTAPAEYAFAEKDYTFEVGGSKDAPAEFRFTLDNPVVYNGGNLMLTMKRADGWWNSLYFAVHTADANRSLGVSKAFLFSDETVNAGNIVPTIILSVPQDALNVTGTVTKENEPAVGASVALKSGDVHYYGTTDSEGKFSVPVIQTGKEYSLTVNHGDNEYLHPVMIAFPEGKDVNVGNIAFLTTGISNVTTDGNSIRVEGNEIVVKGNGNVKVYTVDGHIAATAVADGEVSIPVARGLYIVELSGETPAVSKVIVR